MCFCHAFAAPRDLALLHWRRAVRVMLAALVCSSVTACLASAQEPVRIALKPTVTASNSVLTFAQLAELTGGDSGARQAIARLDLSINREANQNTISRQEALARLLIAGFDPSQFQLDGPNDVKINSLDDSFWMQKARQAITRRVSQGLNLSEADIAVELADGAAQRLAAFNQYVPHVRLVALEHGDRLIGRKNVELGVFQGTQMQATVGVPAITMISRDVIVTSRPIERGEVMDLSNTFVERRRFDHARIDQFLTADGLGLPARRRIRAQHVLRTGDVAKTTDRSAEFVVRPRDMVQAVVNNRGLKISLSGVEVLKAGRVGELVPVRNPVSKKTFYARVKSASLVQVD